MKKQGLNKYCILLSFISITAGLWAQDSATRESVLGLRYFSSGNKTQYLLVQTRNRAGKKFIPVKNVPVTVFLDSDSSEVNLIGNVISNENGEAKVIFPASLKEIWKASPQHNLIAIAKANKEFDEIKTELGITKSKIVIDTSSDGEARNITVTVAELKDGKWLPAKDVEMKIRVKRLGGDLPVNDEETYTTDSTGQVIAGFNRDSLPGDEKGNILLVAQVEDNEFYGNLEADKLVPWGVYIEPENNFDKRTLWATRSKTPVWLLFMAYSIIISVWGVLIYLVVQLFKIRKLGSSTGSVYKDQQEH